MTKKKKSRLVQLFTSTTYNHELVVEQQQQ
jgi:hypothetical protein